MSMLDNYRAAGVQARFRARAEAAVTAHERGVWSRAALVHALVGRRGLGIESVARLGFVHWLSAHGHVGGPNDGGREGTDTVPGARDDERSPSLPDGAGRIVRWLPARCQRCGRFVAGRIPAFCPGCRTVHCPFCGVPDRCEHLVTTIARGTASPPLRPEDDGSSSVTAGRWSPVGLLSATGYPVHAIVLDVDPDKAAGEAQTVYFAWRPAEVLRRLAQVIGASSGQKFGRHSTRQRHRTGGGDALLIPCGGEQHRVILPSRGPIVLVDHPDGPCVEATLAGPELAEGCLAVLRHVRGRTSYDAYGWNQWSIHVAPKFGPAGGAIRELLMEFDWRRILRRMLRDVDLV